MRLEDVVCCAVCDGKLMEKNPIECYRLRLTRELFDHKALKDIFALQLMCGPAGAV